MATGDHKIALAVGGTNELSNGMMLCGYCNSSKSTGTLEELRERNKKEGILPSDPSPQMHIPLE